MNKVSYTTNFQKSLANLALKVSEKNYDMILNKIINRSHIKYIK